MDEALETSVSRTIPYKSGAEWKGTATGALGPASLTKLIQKRLAEAELAASYSDVDQRRVVPNQMIIGQCAATRPPQEVINHPGRQIHDPVGCQNSPWKRWRR